MRKYVLLFVITVLPLAGCTEHRSTPAHDIPSQATRVEPVRTVIGHSVNGTPLECLVYGNGEQTVFILGAIHGSEPAGTPLLRKLAEHLDSHPDLLRGRRVILLPLANPDGLARGKRGNAHGVDLNRNFPAANYAASNRNGAAALSEPESQAIESVIRNYRPARVISIHQPLTCVDYDGPAENLAQRMAATTDLPVRRIGSLPGSLGSYVGTTLGLVSICIELPRGAHELTPQDLWTRYGQMLLIAING